MTLLARYCVSSSESLGTSSSTSSSASEDSGSTTGRLILSSRASSGMPVIAFPLGPPMLIPELTPSNRDPVPVVVQLFGRASGLILNAPQPECRIQTSNQVTQCCLSVRPGV